MPWRKQKESPHSRGRQAIGSKHEIRPNEGPEEKHPLTPLSVSRGIRGSAPSHIVADHKIIHCCVVGSGEHRQQRDKDGKSGVEGPAKPV